MAYPQYMGQLLRNQTPQAYSYAATADSWQQAMRDAFNAARSGHTFNRPMNQHISNIAERLGKKLRGSLGMQSESGGFAAQDSNPLSVRYSTVQGIGANAGKTEETFALVPSTCVASFDYFPNAQDMDITFRGGNGTIYTYHNVTPSVWDAWNKAQSKGQFLNWVLKPNTWKLGSQPKSAKGNVAASYMRKFAENTDMRGIR